MNSPAKRANSGPGMPMSALLWVLRAYVVYFGATTAYYIRTIAIQEYGRLIHE